MPAVVTFTTAGTRSRVLHFPKEADMAASKSKPAGPAPSQTPSKASDESSSGKSSAEGNRPPVHTLRYGLIKVSIWENEAGNGSTFFSVTVSRSYQDERDEWHDTQSFNFSDLPTLAKAVNDAHSWCAWTMRQRKQPES